MTEVKTNNTKQYQENVDKMLEIQNTFIKDMAKLKMKSYYIKHKCPDHVQVHNSITEHYSPKSFSCLLLKIEYFPLDKVTKLLELVTNDTQFQIFDISNDDDLIRCIHVRQYIENNEYSYKLLLCGEYITFKQAIIDKECFINILQALIEVHQQNK